MPSDDITAWQKGAWAGKNGWQNWQNFGRAGAYWFFEILKQVDYSSQGVLVVDEYKVDRKIEYEWNL